MLRVAVVNVWSATNVIRLVSGHQRQRRKDVRVSVMKTVLIDGVCILAGDGSELSGHQRLSDVDQRGSNEGWLMLNSCRLGRLPYVYGITAASS